MKKTHYHILLFSVFLSPVFGQLASKTVYPDEWHFSQSGDKERYAAHVPGSLYTDLHAATLIPDPYTKTNEQDVQWVQEKEWEYTGILTGNIKAEAQQYSHAELVCEGLDTYASVYFNDTLVMETDNMFRCWRKDIKKLTREQNVIRIVFHPVLKKAKDEASKLNYTLPEGERVFTRKAQYHYGWDFAPRLLNSGITKPVSLHFWNDARIASIRFIQQRADSLKASGDFKVNLQCGKPGNYQLQLLSDFGEKKTVSLNLKKGNNEITVPVAVEYPKLWWCNGMGEANTYEADFYLVKDSLTLEASTQHIGFRTLELVQGKDAFGKSFYFKLNGKPFFIKGANYSAQDQLRTSDYPFLHSLAGAGFNMLRVWGGGIYESDKFYSMCDEYGLLVWQDFMFACAMYPGDKKFIQNVKQEITEQVTRIQHHPCIALWCGNNESDEGWKNWGWQKQFAYSQKDSAEIWKNYTTLFQKEIPAVIKSLDPKHPYISTSPAIGWGHKESLLEGDSHYWGVWWGKEPFDVYEKKVGRFVSEYGFQSLPSVVTYRKYCTDSLSLNSPCVKQHQKHKEGFAIIDEYMQRDYKIPEKFEDYIYVSQLLQAAGMKTAIEAHRRAKPYCMGTLFWQLNDCWPAASWSVIDYNGNRKAAFYEVQRGYKDILVSVKEEHNAYHAYIVSEKQYEIKGELEMKVCHMNGKVLWTKKTAAVIPANSGNVYAAVPAAEFSGFDKSNTYLLCCFTSVSRQNNESTIFYFNKPKDLSLQTPMLKIKHISLKEIEISSDVLVKNLYLYYPDKELLLSDNFFDLVPGEKKIIEIQENGIDLNKIRMRSLVDLQTKN